MSFRVRVARGTCLVEYAWYVTWYAFDGRDGVIELRAQYSICRWGDSVVPVEAFMFQINKRLDAWRGKSTI